jgi:predicted PurR-regulated permease PerM
MDATPAVAGNAGLLPPAQRSQWQRTWVVVGVALLVAFAAFVVWQGSTTIFYVVMSWFAALAMEPAVGRLTRWMPRGAATAAVMLGILLAVVGFLWAFGALLVDQLAQLVKAFPDIADEVLAALNRATGSSYTYDELMESTGLSVDDITAYADDVAFGVLGLLAAVLSTVFGLFVVAFFVFYLSVGMPTLRTWLARRVTPRLQVPFLAAWDLTRIKVGGYIAARVVLASINSVASGIFFAVIGLPYWLPLALWTGIVAQFIPNVGTYISIALPTIVGLTSGDPMLGVYVLAYGIAYQQVENLTLEPRISAAAVDVHPAVSFGSAILGAQLFGLSGALLAVPVAATAMAMLEIYKRRYELTPETEDQVAALVAPRALRGGPGAVDPPTGAEPPDGVVPGEDAPTRD